LGISFGRVNKAIVGIHALLTRSIFACDILRKLLVRGKILRGMTQRLRAVATNSGLKCRQISLGRQVLRRLNGLAIRGARNALADRLKILLDMNLSPRWIASPESGCHSAVLWSSIGSPSALDTEIMARENRYIVFTNDLDHGALLFATAAASPSVIQIRAEDIRPASAEHAVLFALEAAAEDLSTGALVIIDPCRLRISMLPLRRGTPEPFVKPASP
jgi:predicted nuclease of predicted toxin-antitoxin system